MEKRRYALLMVGYWIEIIIILYSINVTQFKYAIEQSRVDEESEKPFENRKNISQTLKNCLSN